MARILYGVQGDNNGNISRSLCVAELLKGHELLFVGGGTALHARKAGYAFEEVPVMGITERNNRLALLPDISNAVKKRSGQKRQVERLAAVMRAFDPDLILTDCEYYTPRAANLSGRPYYTLDHQRVLSRTAYRTDPGWPLRRFIFVLMMNICIPGPQGSLISSFHQPPLLYPESDAICGTLPRADALALRPAQDEHAIMYLPGCNLQAVCNLFGGRKRQYRVYGLGQLPERGNLLFRAPGRESFLEDLASAAYVISCGGHGLITEAMLLGKPCLCFPNLFLYEKFWNAHFIQEKGYGRYYTSFSIAQKELEAFEASLDVYRQNILALDFDGRATLKRSLDALLAGS